MRKKVLCVYLPCRKVYVVGNVPSCLLHSSSDGPGLLSHTWDSVLQRPSGRSCHRLCGWTAFQNSPARRDIMSLWTAVCVPCRMCLSCFYSFNKNRFLKSNQLNLNLTNVKIRSRQHVPAIYAPSMVIVWQFNVSAWSENQIDLGEDHCLGLNKTLHSTIVHAWLTSAVYSVTDIKNIV